MINLVLNHSISNVAASKNQYSIYIFSSRHHGVAVITSALHVQGPGSILGSVIISLLVINLALTHNILNVATSKNHHSIYNFSRHHGVAVISFTLHAEGPGSIPGRVIIFSVDYLFGINSQHIECFSVKKSMIQYTTFQDTMV